MKAFLKNKLAGRKVLILGFGVEGQSTYRLLRGYFPELPIAIADRCDSLPNHGLCQHALTTTIAGPTYLDCLSDFDLIIKTPGLPLRDIPAIFNPSHFTSQTGLFLEAYRNQVVGITGTKGKTTTASLVHHIFKAAGLDTLLVGNMGRPPFEVIKQISPQTQVVFELSSHQLETATVSPKVALLLNIYQEHLDHYKSYLHYQLAKYNIARFQQPDDYFIYFGKDQRINTLIRETPLKSKLIAFGTDSPEKELVFIRNGVLYAHLNSRPEKICEMRDLKALAGDHNRLNLAAAAAACLIKEISPEVIGKAAMTFESLPHRLEKVGVYGGKIFYNDSIATIPEAVMMAVDTLRDVDCLILGGYDRGIDYHDFAAFLSQSTINHLVLTGKAGLRLYNILQADYQCAGRCSFFEKFDDAAIAAIVKTESGKICLLSPAASSYDQFKNFEHRGNRFREIIEDYFSQ